MDGTSNQFFGLSQLLKLLSEKDETISALEASVDLLLNLIAHLPGNIYWKDLNGKYLGCNNNVANILLGTGSVPQDIIGKTNSELFKVELAISAEEIDEKVLRFAQEITTEELGLNSDNEPAIYLTKKAPLLDKNNKMVGIIGISFDISERKQMEQELLIAKEVAEASNKAKSRFLAIINHELRTPLTGIIGLINMLNHDNIPQDEKVEILGNLKNCANYLYSLINHVLDFCRLESEADSLSNLKTMPTDLAVLIKNVLSVVTVLAKQKGLEMYAEIDENFPNILTDPELLYQILINLTNNAIKFTTKGSVSVSAKYKMQNAETLQLEIAIQDTGCGIPQDKLELIFEPFSQLENSYVRETSQRGTGLGLSIVKKLLKKLKLDIKVMSEMGKGSTFTVIGDFLIERKIADLDVIKTDSSSKKHQRHIVLTRPAKILLVEDDLFVRRVHQYMLKDLNFEVNVAINGSEAIGMFETHDLIFIDLGLPDMSGFDLIKIIRQDRQANLPIIALTGYLGEEERSKCLTLGADDLLVKPVSFEELKRTLGMYISTLGNHVGKLTSQTE